MKKKWMAWILVLVMVIPFANPAPVSAEGPAPSDWAVPEVTAAANAGILDGEYDYQSPVTRLQFSELIYRMICVKKGLPIPVPDDSEPAGPEVSDPDDDPGENFLPGPTEALAEGTTDDGDGADAEEGEDPADVSGDDPAEEGTEPAAPVEPGTPSPFTDVDNVAVTAMNEYGILQGYGDGTFHPEDPITREQIACILTRTAGCFGITNPNGYVTAFLDGKDFSSWAVREIKFISAQETPSGVGVMRGYDSRFHPKGNCTVEEGILAVYRLYRSLERGNSTDTSWIGKRGWLLTEVKISAAGDCTLGRDHNSAYANSLDQVYDNSGGDAGLFFRRVKPFFSDDVTIVNFEGTLTDANQPAVKTYRFKGRKAYTHILTEGSVEVVNIANNHSHDYLDRGYADTYNTLTGAGVGVCGNGYTCIREVNGIKIGFYGLAPMGSGLTQSYKDTIRARINTLKNQGAQFIVGSFHWGIERAYTANANQKQIAHYAVDCGTNLVIGHHPHVLQNTEIYNGVQIIYSLGNFCFGGNRNPSDKDTAVYRENLVMDLETGKVQSRTRIFYPYRLSSVTYRNDYQPVPVSGTDADRVKRKLWI